MSVKKIVERIWQSEKKLIQQSWRIGRILEVWKISLIQPIRTKRENKDANNYRGIGQ